MKAFVRGVVIVGVSCYLAACAPLNVLGGADAPDANVLARALSGELLLGKHWETEDLPEQALFALTPAMQHFAESTGASSKRNFARAQALQRGLLLPVASGGLGLTYSAVKTRTPAEAFAERRVNCVSFTLMYVAMARHIGLDAYVNEVDLPPSWDLRNRDAFLFLRHVNAKVKLGRNDVVVIDLEMDRYSPAYEQRYISEALAEAQFYNNRGMELSAAGDVKQGFLHLRKALLLDNQQSYIWSNFGTLYHRQGLLPEAEAAYLYGLSLAADDLTIMTNLSTLYRRMGADEKANGYFRRAEQHRANNPYYRYSKAFYALDEGRLEEALDLITQAIRKRREEPRFYKLAADIYERLGDATQAAAMREKMRHYEVPAAE